ncbi:hypothetical protein PtB15_5B645 [Puccinia triticina]|nr:hypothetical protein PtB15_5B645 [Puccinia triticina]
MGGLIGPSTSSLSNELKSLGVACFLGAAGTNESGVALLLRAVDRRLLPLR